MSDSAQAALPLLAPLPSNIHLLEGEWRVAFASPAAVEIARPDFQDQDWEIVGLPHLRPGTPENDTLWYRCHFQLPPQLEQVRTLLRFGGAFYETQAWLNGVELGSHTGYFQPFGFDPGPAWQVGKNLLVVSCRFPVEVEAFKSKTVVAGVFADWDCKPYPSMFYPNLPPAYQWKVPVGLWRPVYLQSSGDVLVESFNVFPEVQSPDWNGTAESAVLRVVLGLHNLSQAERSFGAGVAISPHNFPGETTLQDDWDVRLPAGTRRRIEFRLTLPQPRLWFPWTHGEPALYRAALSIKGGPDPSTGLVQVFGVRSIEARIDTHHWEWRLNGRRIFPKGSNIIPDLNLDRLNLAGMSRDLALVRQANLDLLRVHAHITSPDFYCLCDEQGLMVMCDFPLIWSYGYGLPEPEQDRLHSSVVRQAGEMVELLGSHPGIVLWSMHNEPPWTPDGSFLGPELHESQTNREMDEAAAALALELDGTRPVIPASGLYDQHLYHGWYVGHWRDNRRLSPIFPSEFGVQALPNLDSPFWETVNTDWPVETEEPSWAYAGYQSIFWVSPGVGAPKQYPSLAAYVAASQTYQAAYTGYVIDQWRRKKFQPTGGFIHFLFNDGWPAITWSVLDNDRRPKAAYQALQRACAPTHVCFDIEDDFEFDGGFNPLYPRGSRFKARLYLVNDDYRVEGQAELTWWLEPQAGKWLSAILRRFAMRRRVAIPNAGSGAFPVADVSLPLLLPGAYTFCSRLSQDGRTLDENRFHLNAGTPRHSRRLLRRVPGFLVNRIYRSGSLHRVDGGFAFHLHNPAMPVQVQRLVALQVNGVEIDVEQIEVKSREEVRRAASITPTKPLEINAGEDLTVTVHEHPLSSGYHELETTLQFITFGEFSARWRDRILTDGLGDGRD